jgi:hypothetical protein
VASIHGSVPSFPPSETKKVSSAFSNPPSSLLGFSVTENRRVLLLQGPNLGWVERACGIHKDSLSGWKETTEGDYRSYAQVVQVKLAPRIMVPPCPNRGWGGVVLRQGEGVVRAELVLEAMPSIVRHMGMEIRAGIIGRIVL